MKQVILSLLALATVGAFAQKKEVSIEKSKIEWKGYKVLGSHEGEIQLKNGALIFDNGKLTGGKFTVDMTTISVGDLEGEYAEKLKNHLKSDDFFGVEKFPTSSLEFVKVSPRNKNSYNVKANLTIKGKTNPVEFVLSVYGKKAKANVKIDRTLYDIKYSSGSFFDGLGDKVIYDEFDLDVELEWK